MTKHAPKKKELLDLEANDCRWPIGDPRQAEFHFCGAEKVLGRPYCIQHWTLSFVPSRGRQQANNMPVVQVPAIADKRAA